MSEDAHEIYYTPEETEAWERKVAKHFDREFLISIGVKPDGEDTASEGGDRR